MGNDYNCCDGQQQQLENDVQITKTPKIGDGGWNNLQILLSFWMRRQFQTKILLRPYIVKGYLQGKMKIRRKDESLDTIMALFIKERSTINKPNGYGRIYQTDGTLGAGLFQHGNKVGEHYLFLPDGSFYKGNVQNGQISKGIYKSHESFTYQGPFQNYQFHGRGKEHHKDYEFSGEYLQGKRVQGQLRWKQKNVIYSYIGRFDDQGRFQGFGILSTREGIYKGGFKAGLKNERGVMEFTNGLTYEGFYQDGEKNGYGKIINSNGTLCYEGEFKAGLPHDGENPTMKKGDKSKENSGAGQLQFIFKGYPRPVQCVECPIIDIY